MKKDPAILFYFRDFLTSTDLMTNEQVGAHIRILCHQADKGHLPESSIRERICGSIWESLMGRYRQDEQGLWYHPRMDAVLKERGDFVKGRLENLEGKGHVKTPHGKPTRTPHMDTSPSPSPIPLSNPESLPEPIKDKRQDKLADPRYQDLLSSFCSYWQMTRNGNPPVAGKDGKHLKSLLARQPSITKADFEKAMGMADSDAFHAKNFSLAYVASKYEILLNLGVADGKGTSRSGGRFVGEFEKGAPSKYDNIKQHVVVNE